MRHGAVNTSSQVYDRCSNVLEHAQELVKEGGQVTVVQDFGARAFFTPRQYHRPGSRRPALAAGGGAA